jgi:NAD(P)-dependent dehydrogenase (short-subunit alcohol dehydrogenase family)
MTRSDDTAVPDYQSLLRLDGRRFVLIGAGQGIGRQSAHALAGAGSRVLCVDVDEGLAQDIAGEVNGVAWSGDATRRDEVERMFVDAGAALGGVDGVVDIVGIARFIELLDVTDDEWDWYFSMNLRHAFLAMQIGARAMGPDGGVMVFVASASGLTSAPRHAPYGAAKAGLMSLVRTGAVELGPKHIRVNAVAPGVVWTPRVSGMLGDEGKANQSRNAPLGTVAYPSDIAAGILFFATPLSGNISGQTLSIDGGVSAKFPFGMENV